MSGLNDRISKLAKAARHTARPFVPVGGISASPTPPTTVGPAGRDAVRRSTITAANTRRRGKVPITLAKVNLP